MAEKKLITYEDDLDPTQEAAVINYPFSIGGVEYEIDLSETNLDRLAAAVELFVNAARRVGGRKVRIGPSSRSATNGHAPKSNAAAIREWAQENGFDLSGRGRIPGHVTNAYHEAQAQAQPAKRSRRKASI